MERGWCNLNNRSTSGLVRAVVLIAAGILVLLFAVMLAPYLENGLPGMLAAGDDLAANMFHLRLCDNTGRTVLVCLFIYGLVVLVILSNPKNYRRREEHGSARWESARRMNRKLSNRTEPTQNRIMTQHLELTTDQRKLGKNLFTLVLGGSGARKTRAYVKPNLLQCNSSYVITDPKGELLRDIGGVFVHEGYKVRVFDLKNMKNSYRYNPFVYFRDDNDIQKLAANLFANTEDKTKTGGDAFWDKTAQMMLSAFMYYVWHEAPDDEKNFGTVMELVRGEDVPNGKSGEDYKSATQLLFEQLRAKHEDHIALRYFDSYRKGAGETIQSFQESLLSRLEKFNLQDVIDLTTGDEMDLWSVGESKTAIFIVMPDNDSSFNFLASMLVTQLFQVQIETADHKYADCGGSLPVPVHFVLEEFANITLPDDFQKWVATMRSRNITLSIILQNLAQLKKIFPHDWESVAGLCDEILYLGGNEQSTNKWVSDFLGSETIDINSFGVSHGRGGSSSKNEQSGGRALLDAAEVRLKDKARHGKLGSAIVILTNEYPVIDEKYDLNRHPRIKLSADGGAPIYDYAQAVPDAFSPGSSLYVNEDDIPESDIVGELTVDSNAVIRVPIARKARVPPVEKQVEHKAKRHGIKKFLKKEGTTNEQKKH